MLEDTGHPARSVGQIRRLVMHRRQISLLVGLLLLGIPSRGSGQEERLKKQVNEAIDKGVAHLKKSQQPDGSWTRAEGWQRVGATALAGWTLLECGEDPNGDAIRNAATVVREAASTDRHTYSLSLAILFLDRLGDPDDAALIDSMAVRLLAGQSRHGGWVYEVPAVPAQESTRLRALLRRRPESRELPKEHTPVKNKVRTFDKLPKEIQLLWISVRDAAAFFQELDGDNSNTQFASLALWVARRRGLPVDDGLLLIEQRFRSTQWDNGGWGYMPAKPPAGAKNIQLPPGSGPSAAMSCAGLIGLAVGHGVRHEKGSPADMKKDKVLKAGLQAVGSTVGTPTGDAKKAIHLEDGGRAYYYFWTLERMAVLYDLEKIGGRDWYSWGAEILVHNQKSDGSWQGEFRDGGCDTCFALLFLRRSNVAPDLTKKLSGKVHDPGKSAIPIRLQTPVGGQMKGPGVPPGSKKDPGLTDSPWALFWSPSGLQAGKSLEPFGRIDQSPGRVDEPRLALRDRRI
jgi:hypothetical protein